MSKKLLKIEMLSVLLCLVILMAGPAVAGQLPIHYPVPGGIAVIKLPTDSQPDAAFLNNRRIMVQKNDNNWYAIAGISLSTKPADYSISYKINGKIQKAIFTVNPKTYQSQHLTIKNKRKVNPNKQDLQRIGRERKLIRRALTTWSDQAEIPLQFNIPVEGRFSSPFGLRRFFNGQARRPHSGLDIAASEGTPIKAPAAGKVIAVGDYFFNGKTVFLDHGQGLVTMFCHMSKIRVNTDQVIRQGDHIGDVGMTGRVTGPHLHWSVSLNNARVEPRLLMGPEYTKKLTSSQ